MPFNQLATAVPVMPPRRRSVKFSRLYLQVPEPTMRQFKEIVDQDYGHRGQKLLGTAMVTMMVGFPREIRDALYDWGLNAESRPDIAGNHRAAVEGFLRCLKELIHTYSTENDNGEREDLHWFIDRILDPEVFGIESTQLRQAVDRSKRKSG